MKANRITTFMTVSLAAGAACVTEAATAFGGAVGTGVLDSFKAQHPLAMVMINMLILVILLGLGAIAFATIFKSPGES